MTACCFSSMVLPTHKLSLFNHQLLHSASFLMPAQRASSSYCKLSSRLARKQALTCCPPPAFSMHTDAHVYGLHNHAFVQPLLTNPMSALIFCFPMHPCCQLGHHPAAPSSSSMLGHARLPATRHPLLHATANPSHTSLHVAVEVRRSRDGWP